MLEITVCVEVESDQNSYDLGIRHHAFSTAFGSVDSGPKGIFCHLNFKFFAKIVGNTENFSNLTLGNHDIAFIVCHH